MAYAKERPQASPPSAGEPQDGKLASAPAFSATKLKHPEHKRAKGWVDFQVNQ